jgi:ABC-type glycerol-3-phosphate transport system substrate-binding protein
MLKRPLTKGNVSLLALVLVLVQPFGPVQAATRTSAGFHGTITFWAQDYTPAQAYNPPRSMKITSTNPTPRRALLVLAQKWEKMHPGVHIKFVTKTPGDVYTWFRTVLTGETAPDIMWWQTDPRFTDEGKVVPLDKWVNKPNPYNNQPGNPDRGLPWKDTFLPGYEGAAQSPNHHFSWVPMDLVSTGIYYNESLLKKAGLNPTGYRPATWAQWMKDMARIQRAGIIPFCSDYVPLAWWAWGILGDQLMWRDVAKYDVLHYKPTHVRGTLDEEEMVRAILREGWLPSKDQGFRELMRVMKDWSQYWCSGWAVPVTGPTASARDYQLFVTNKLAFMWEGTWVNAEVRNDPKRGFPFGTFYLTPFTRATSSAVKNPPIKPKAVGGYGGINFCVTKSAVNDGSVNLAVDFLQFITTPQNDSYVVNEQPQYVVAVKGAPDTSGLGRFFEGGKDMMNAFTYGISIYNTLNPKWSAKIDEIATEYFQGQRSLDSALHRLDIEARQQAQAELQLNDKTKSKLGTWDTSKW